jgi:O-succinylbenzoate synthase
VLVAADESIRRAEDPYEVARLDAADIAVLKVQPLGGVRACLEIAERIGLPIVVSSALETSVGIAAGVALAAALPELPYACGLATVQLLEDDVTSEPLLPVDGMLPVRRVVPDPVALERTAAPPPRVEAWESRLAAVRDTARDLVGREILTRTSTQRRGTAVQYGPGPRFPERRSER